MKSKGLLGGKYLPVAKESIDVGELDKDVKNETELNEQQVDMNNEKGKRNYYDT